MRPRRARPACAVLMFERCALSRDAGITRGWAQARRREPAGTMAWARQVERGEFGGDRRGSTRPSPARPTQVNYTYRSDGRAYGSPPALYRLLRAPAEVSSAPASCCRGGGHARARAAGALPAREDRHRRPMKGIGLRFHRARGRQRTARLLGGREEPRREPDDRRPAAQRPRLRRADRLGEGAGAVRDRALLDGIPDDLHRAGHAAARGRHARVLLRAVFPCGSITGAPGTTRWQLDRRDPRARRAASTVARSAGRRAARGRAPRRFRLSVAIRTLALVPPGADGTRRCAWRGCRHRRTAWAADEFEGVPPGRRASSPAGAGFELFETARASRRLAAAARAPPRAAAAQRRQLGLRVSISAAARAAIARGRHRRAGTLLPACLALAKSGRLTLTRAVLAPLTEGEPGCRIAPQRLAAPHPLVAHKTSWRAAYDAGTRRQKRSAFDNLFSASGGAVERAQSLINQTHAGASVHATVADALPGVVRCCWTTNSALAERRLTPLLDHKRGRCSSATYCRRAAGAEKALSTAEACGMRLALTSITRADPLRRGMWPAGRHFAGALDAEAGKRRYLAFCQRYVDGTLDCPPSTAALSSALRRTAQRGGASFARYSGASRLFSAP